MPDVFGVIVIQLAAVLAVQEPDPEVKTEPPPPSFAKDRLVGLIAICAIAEAARQKPRQRDSVVFMVFLDRQDGVKMPILASVSN